MTSSTRTIDYRRHAEQVYAACQERGAVVSELPRVRFPLRHGEYVGVGCINDELATARLYLRKGTDHFDVGLQGARVEDWTELWHNPVPLRGLINGEGCVLGEAAVAGNALFARIFADSCRELYVQTASEDIQCASIDETAALLFAGNCLHAIKQRIV